jgi:regulator of RNase E activity RraB
MSSHYESLLNETVDIYTPTISSNSLGESIVTMSLSESDIKCRLVPVSAKRLMEMPGKFDDVRYDGYFLDDQVISTDDEVLFDGDTYRVREVYTDSSGHTQKTLLGIK